MHLLNWAMKKGPLVGWGYNRGWNNYYPVIGVQGYIGKCLPKNRYLHDFFLFLFILLTGKNKHSKTLEKMRKTKTSRCFFVWCPWRLATRAFRRHETDRGMHLQLLFLRWNASLQQVCTLAQTYELGWQRDELIVVVGGWGWLVGYFGWWFLREDEIELPCYIGIRDFFSLANYKDNTINQPV